MHGLHTHLLTRNDYQAILKAKDAKSVADYLMKGDYAQLLEKTSAEYPTALRLAKVFQSLLVSRSYGISGIAPERCRAFLDAYLERFIVEDMKRVLRAKHTGKVVDKGALIQIPKGQDRVNLQAMADAATLQEAVTSLSRTRYGAVEDFIPAYEKYRLVSIFEASLEKVYFDSEVRPTLSGLPERSSVEEMIGTEVDLANIRTMADLRARKVASDAVKSLSFTPFNLKPSELAQISAATPESLPQVVSKTRYSALAQPLQDALESGKDESLDHVVRMEIFRRTRKMMVACADTFAYVLGYLKEAETESNNLMSLVTGKELGLAEVRIQAAICV